MIKHWIEGPLRAVVDAANVSVGMGILERIRVAVDRQHHEELLSFSLRTRRRPEGDGNENAVAYMTRLAVAGDYFGA